MSNYHQMKQKLILKTLGTLHEFSEKFPMLTVSDINLYELAKHYDLHGKDFESMIVFMDCMKNIKLKDKETKEKMGSFVDLMKVKSIQIKKKQDNWTFKIKDNDDKTFRIEHKYALKK